MPRRIVALAVVIAVLVAGCSGRASHRGTDPTPVAAAAATLDDLRSAGLLVVPSEADAVEPAHGQFLLTQVQADRMLAEQASGGGILGSDVDDVAPMPADAPPMSYLLAGWVSNPQTPAARTALRLMGTQDWKHAPAIVFPTAILAMFVADAANAVDTAATGQAEPATTSTGSALAPDAQVPMVPVALLAPADGPCSAVTNFLASTIKGLFDALHLTVPTNGGFFGTIVTVLAVAWDTAVSLAQGIVSGIVDALTAPVFEVMRIAIGALGVATTLVSYLKDQELTVTLDPGATTTDTYRFAVEAEADIRGDFVATAKSLTGDWPAALKDCAKVSGADLPELIAVGGKATWVVLDNEGLIAPGPLETLVLSDRSAHLTFTTGRESEEQATKGEPRFDVAAVRIDIPRKEIGTFLDFAQGQIAGVRGQILSKIPQADLRNLADAKLGEILDPAVNRLRSEVESLAGGVFMLSGTGVVVVKHHGAPDPSPTPSASPSDGDFCKKYSEMVQWSYDHQGTMLSSEWAGEIARQLAAMQPLAPPSLASDVTVLGDIYTLVANQTAAAVIGNEVATKDFPGAAMRVGTFCKIDPSRFSLN